MRIEEVHRRLKVYRALDNEVRLRAFLTIREQPSISFNDLSRRIEVERGLLAYHLAVLKEVGIVKVDYGRRSKQTSRYRLTHEGEKIAQELCSGIELRGKSSKRGSRKSSKGSE